MEQQNQQGIQEKTENKPPVKTNWKFIAIVAVLGLIVGGGLIARLKGLIEDSSIPLVQPAGISRVQIDDCVQDNECILVDYQDCCVPPQIAINKKYKAEYERHPEWQKASDERLDFCALVDCFSPWTFVSAKCVNNQCVGVKVEEDNKKVLDTSNWQTYRNDEFGFEMRYPKSFESVSACKLREGTSREARWHMILGNSIDMLIFDAGGLDLDQYVNQNFPKNQLEEVTESEIFIGNNKGIHITYRGGGLGRYGEVTFFERDGKIYKFSFFARPICLNAQEFDESELSVLQEILSTFRFAE